jgi:hypothetical protein
MSQSGNLQSQFLVFAVRTVFFLPPAADHDELVRTPGFRITEKQQE